MSTSLDGFWGIAATECFLFLPLGFTVCYRADGSGVESQGVMVWSYTGILSGCALIEAAGGKPVIKEGMLCRSAPAGFGQARFERVFVLMICMQTVLLL